MIESLCGQSLEKFAFMTGRTLNLSGIKCHVSRSGYTGEDGFEVFHSIDELISVDCDRAWESSGIFSDSLRK